MNNEDFFTKIEEPIETNINIINKAEVVEEENQFIKGLPDWDLEPPFETIRRDNEL